MYEDLRSLNTLLPVGILFFVLFLIGWILQKAYRLVTHPDRNLRPMGTIFSTLGFVLVITALVCGLNVNDTVQDLMHRMRYNVEEASFTLNIQAFNNNSLFGYEEITVKRDGIYIKAVGAPVTIVKTTTAWYILNNLIIENQKN